MNINDILKEEALLLESGVRIPKGTTSAKILHHDDFDGIISAAAIGIQLKKQGITKITTELLHDSDAGVDQVVKLGKRKGQMLLVVDFNRFKDAAAELAKQNVNAGTDHHEGEDTGNIKVKSEFQSDVMHISTKVAQGYITGTDLAIMNGIDSAQFGKNLETNVYLKKEMKKHDKPSDKKMRLAIITSSVLGQMARSKASRNPGAIKSIIRDLIKSPSVLTFYSSVKKHVDIARQQAEIISAYEGKKSGEVDWEKVEKFNKNAPKEMNIGKDTKGGIRKNTVGRSHLSGKPDKPSTEEEMDKANAEKAKSELTTDAKGQPKLIAGVPGDADLKAWELKDKYKPISSKDKSAAWNRATEKAMKKAKDKWPSDKDAQKKLIVPLWKKEMNKLQQGAPGIKMKTDNIAVADKFGHNRYMAYQDPKVASAIRDFGKFWQMAMSPSYYKKFEEAAKKNGKEFKAEEIDLVTLGKEAMVKVAAEKLSPAYLKKKGFDEPEALSKDLKTFFDADLAKSGGHKAITNIGMENLFKNTADKYQAAAKRAKKLDGPKAAALQKKFEEIAKKFDYFFKYDFKKAIQDELSAKVQAKVSKTKSDLLKKLKEDIQKNVGMNING